MELKEYWKARRELEADLLKSHPGGTVSVQPLENRLANSSSGLCCDVNADVAARLIMAGSHRPANAEEIARAVSHGEAQHRMSEAAQNRNDGKVTLKLTVDSRTSRKG